MHRVVLQVVSVASLACLAQARPEPPLITPSPVQQHVSKTQEHGYLRRDILSAVTADIESVLSALGSDVPSWVASGVEPYFQGLPTGDAVVSSLGLQSSELAAIPTQALNIDPYANFTDQGWNVRFHGNIYKQPNTSVEDLNKLADGFLIGTNISSLPESQQEQARNVTAEIYVVQQGDVNVSTILAEAVDGGAGGSQSITLPFPTTPEGDFDVFVPIKSNGLQNGNETQSIQTLNTWVTNTTLGNATAYLVPNEGLTVISDIDDILRVTQIYDPKDGLDNTFAKPFTPWQNMPEIYANWSRSLPNLHFHYLTTTPEQVTRNYMQFIFANYPLGSFDDRPLNFSDVSATLSIRQFLLTKIFETFPQRKFILIADTSNSDVMRDYPKMAHDYPNQVQCIFLRNTSATDPLDKFPYDTSGFKGLNQTQYMFFINADDLANINIAKSGACYNQSIPQNLTFGYQGLPGGIGSTTSINGSANKTSMGVRIGSIAEGQWWQIWLWPTVMWLFVYFAL